MVKITLIGAGSVVFAKSLICDILQHPALVDSTICLMDIDPGRLATIETLARRIVAQLGLPTRIEASLDLIQACRGARFVITTIQVGGYRPSTVRDFEIPARYGLRQTIADTLGVGGIFRALRTIPELAKIARAIQELGAPDALLLNYTNPMAMAMWGVDRLTGQPAVGLCHSIQGTSEQIAGYCGIPLSDTNYLVAGINHMAFFLRFEYKGKDAYPLLFRALENPSILACDRVRFEMMRRLGYFVTESSEHQAEYTPYFIHHGQEIVERFNIPIDEYIRRCESQLASWGGLERDLLNPDEPVEITRSVEYGATIINSIQTGDPSVIYGNVANKGMITNLRVGCCVEVPCLVDRQGIQPTSVGALPLPLAAIINTNLNVQELAVEAAVTKRRDYIYQAVMMDPHTSASLTLDQMWRLCDDLIEAHQQDGFLSDFQPVFPGSGRSLASLQRVFLTIQPTSAPFAEGVDIAGFLLCAENTTAKAFDGDITLHVDVSELELGPSPSVRVSLPAGESASFPFTLHKTGELTRPAVISILSESTVTVERDYLLPL